MVKRIFDFWAAFLGLIFLSPLLLIISLLVKLTSPGPIFYLQTRMGKEFCPFKIYKFRTMLEDKINSGSEITVEGDPRITALGRTLRRLKFDEFPQLLNVLRGEMSLVGPRPEVPSFVEIFKKDYEIILTVLPGITDWASVEFKEESILLAQSGDALNFYIESVLPEKIQISKDYVKCHNCFLDLKILIRTLGAVFLPAVFIFSSRGGSSPPPHSNK